jgi:hypothetical protein
MTNPLLPSDDTLRAADRIVLIDPKHPGWYEPLYVRMQLRNSVTVEIPVDSSDRAVIRVWRDHIRRLNLDD